MRLFAAALVEAGIETFDELAPFFLVAADVAVRHPPGQASAIAFDYFGMLAGDNIVASDSALSAGLG